MHQRSQAGIGGQQVELRALLRRGLRVAEHGAPALQFAQPIVFRVEAVAGHVAQREQQLVEAIRTRPRRREAVLFVEQRHRVARRFRNVGVDMRAAPLLDPLADLFGHRAQRLLDGRLSGLHGGSQQKPQQGDGLNDAGKSGRHDTVLRGTWPVVIAQPCIGASTHGVRSQRTGS